MKQKKPLFNTKRSTRLQRVALWAMLCLFGSVTAHAEDFNVLVIQFADGTAQSYVLETRPKVTFDAEKLYVKSTNVDDAYEYRSVKKFVFETHNLSGIQTIRENECRLAFLGGAATVGGLATGSTATLCDTAGRNVLKAKADAAGSVTFNLQGLPAGAYIIALSNGKSFKILKH